MIGINPPAISIGSTRPAPLEGQDIVTIASMVADVVEDNLEKLREQLKREADDLCGDSEGSALPPYRTVNHAIPLIDEGKVYPYRPSRCPDALRPPSGKINIAI
ncbi:hypothetical protein FRC02_004608 [Tulasnella sp. 418]|nr:hypothetical protein FRC02_004608 [Tulasnella sp. 418]